MRVQGANVAPGLEEADLQPRRDDQSGLSGRAREQQEGEQSGLQHHD